jgi:uncharacterized repeat protein (TIGR01451 family)
MKHLGTSVISAFVMASILCVVAFTGVQPGSAAAAPPQLTTRPTVIVRAVHTDTPAAHVPPPAGFSTLAVKSAIIEVNFIGSWDSQAQTAFQYAADIWAAQINSSVKIVVEAQWIPLGPGVLGAAGAASYAINFGAPMSNTWYPIALANALDGTDLNGSDPEINASFNSAFPSWYFGTDGQPSNQQYDFVSVVLHELGHGLGFIGSMSVDDGRLITGVECNGTEGVGCWGFGSGFPLVYDRFTQNGSGQSLLSAFANFSTELGIQLQSDDLYFNGSNTNAANAGNPAALFAPNPWQPGSSYSHLDESFNGTSNALMTFSLSNGESNHDPGPVTRGMFQDMGWTFSTQQTAPDLSLSKQVTGGPDFNPGDAVTFVLSVANAGDGTATSVVLTDTLPGDILSPSWLATGALVGATARQGATYVWDLPDLDPGAAGTISVQGTINPGLGPDFVLINRASIRTADQETDESNNSAEVVIGGERLYLPLVLRNDQG